MRLQDKVCLITGASGDIGHAVARDFAKQGAKLVLAARSTDKIEALAAEYGDNAVAITTDVSQKADVSAMVAKATDAFGRPDMLVANAGTEGPVKAMIELDVEDFDKVQQVSVRGTFLSLKHDMPAMMATGGGSCIVTASVVAQAGVAGISAYTASKHALLGLTRAACVEMAPHGIRVNAIGPAPIDNAMMASIKKQAAPDDPSQARAGFSALIPMGRYGTDSEVAKLALFLASDEASFCNGGFFTVDGSFTAQ